MAHRDGKMNWDDLHYQKIGGEYSPFVSYGQSKLANILHAVELSRRIKKDGINVYSLHPGKQRTGKPAKYLEFYNIISFHFIQTNVVMPYCRCDYNRALETHGKMGSAFQDFHDCS